MATQFEFPKIHSFKPLYSRQPNATILSNQLDTWGDIILSYCEYYKITSLTLTGTPVYSQRDDIVLADLPPLFENRAIERALKDDFRTAVLQHLIHKLKRADYINPKQPEAGILVYWKLPAEWATVIHDFVEASGQLGTILTVYELTKSEDSGLPEDLKNMEHHLLVRVVKDVLIKQGKAQILMDDSGEIGGVKIV